MGGGGGAGGSGIFLKDMGSWNLYSVKRPRSSVFYQQKGDKLHQPS